MSARRPGDGSPPQAPFLSVAICTYDRERQTVRLLNALSPQILRDSPACDLLVVNNGPTENILEAVSAMRHARYIREPVKGLSRARNAAISAARGEYVLFLDDDIELPPGYLTAVTASLRANQPDVLGGPIDPVFETAPSPWIPDAFFVRTKALQSGWLSSGTVSGGNFAVRRALFADVGGFRTDLGMVGASLGFLEEYEFVLRVRRSAPGEAQIYYDLGCAVGHAAPREKTRFFYIISRTFRSHYDRGRLFSELATPRRRRALRVATFASAVVDSGKQIIAAALNPKRDWRKAIGETILSSTGRIGVACGALRSPRAAASGVSSGDREPDRAKSLRLILESSGLEPSAQQGETRVVRSYDLNDLTALNATTDFWAHSRLVFDVDPPLRSLFWLAREFPACAIESRGRTKFPGLARAFGFLSTAAEINQGSARTRLPLADRSRAGAKDRL